MKMCRHVTCSFNTTAPKSHKHYMKMNVVHHKIARTAQDDGQTHTEAEWLNRHNCGASKDWMVHHDFNQYGYANDPAHNADGKVWHKDAVEDGTAPVCSCECEHTTMAPIDKMKEFLQKYQTNMAAGTGDNSGDYQSAAYGDKYHSDLTGTSHTHEMKHGVSLHKADGDDATGVSNGQRLRAHHTKKSADDAFHAQ